MSIPKLVGEHVQKMFKTQQTVKYEHKHYLLATYIIYLYFKP